MVNRIIVRWGPQESTNNTPGVNQFATIDPTSFPDNVKGPGYVWHCHIVGHEDHDMLRQLALVNSWKAGTAYVAENVVEFNQVDYRARVNNTAVAGQTPNTRFDLWDRVNNNDGSWQPQIRYAPGRQGDVQRRAVPPRARCSSRRTGKRRPTIPSLWASLPQTLLRPVRPVLPGELQSQRSPVPPRRSGRGRISLQGRGRAVPRLLQAAECSGPAAGSATIRWCSASRTEATSSREISGLARPASRRGRACSRARAAASPTGKQLRSTVASSRSTATGTTRCRRCGTTGTASRSARETTRSRRSRPGERRRWRATAVKRR